MTLWERVREWLGLDVATDAFNAQVLRTGCQFAAIFEQLDRIEKALVVDIPQRKLEPKPRVQTFEDMEQEALKELEKEPT